MRGPLSVAALIALLLVAGLSFIRSGDAATCGRANYPDASQYADASVTNRELWNEFVSLGGFANASQGRDEVTVLAQGPGRNYTVTLAEQPFVDYVGGVSTTGAAVQLRISVDYWNGTRAEQEFSPVSIGGRVGANLTLAVRIEGPGLIVFWRWAFLDCDQSFVNSYYVFHAALDDGHIAADNDLVYFEAPRPRRGPPTDLIILVVAGIAVSVIFLLARHALKREP